MRFLTIIAGLLLTAPVLASPQSAMAAALADARKLPPAIAQQTRYLDGSNLPAEYRTEASRVLDFHANQLSRNSELVKLRRVSPDLWAVVLTDYSWERQVWENLAVIEPHFHVLALWPGGVWPDGRYYAPGTFRYAVPGFWLDQKQAAELTLLTNSGVPLVRADWWFVQSARQLSLNNQQTGAGYYDWLGLKARKDFEKLVRLDEKASVELGKEIRAVVERSGVATQNRQILRLQTLTGGYWMTLDAKSSTNKQNAIRLLGKGDYRHDAEEIFGVLPNGLFGFFLSAADGTRQDSAPDFIGVDDSPLRLGRDARIHIGLACVRCHVEGLRPIDDWVRRTLRSPLQLNVADPVRINEFRRQYFSNLERQREKDNAVYAEALEEISGWKPAEAAKAFAGFWNRYALQNHDLKGVAKEMGLADDELAGALKKEGSPPPAGKGRLDAVLSGLLQSPESKIRPEQLEELMPELWRIYLERTK